MKKSASDRDGQFSFIEPLEDRTLFSSPLVSVGNVDARERALGSVSYALVNVSIARRSTSVVRIGFATKSGTATAGSDFVPVSGTLTIRAGDTVGTIRVRIIGDNIVEGTEKFYLRLTSAVHATLPTSSPYSIIKILDSVPPAPAISNNLSAGSGGVQSFDNENLLAASFTAPSTAVNLTQVTLLIDLFSGSGSPVVVLYSDLSNSPGAPIAQLDTAATITSTLAPTTFVNASGIALSPGAKYWILVLGGDGSFQWSFANSNSGSGTGFTGEWANSVDGGSDWSINTSLPLQMEVGGT